jgi:NitT/TauT family transport system permease protein
MTDSLALRKALPIPTVLLAVLIIWYIAAVWLNADQAQSLMDPDEPQTFWTIAQAALAMDRPVLPAPHQIALSLWDGVFGWPVNSPRSLIYHAGVTAGAALLGLAIALVLGAALAVGIVQSRVLDRSLMPWVIGSQTVPVLAIAPMVVVVLGNLGLTGVLPKAVIAGYLSFFPITVGLVKGLRSPDPMQRDLLHTCAANEAQVLAKLRWPASIGFLFPSLRVAMSLALVGAIVAELPTGAQAGLGARLLAGSYYGQTIQLWAALLMAAFVSLAGLGAIALLERATIAARGGRL